MSDAIRLKRYFFDHKLIYTNDTSYYLLVTKSSIRYRKSKKSNNSKIEVTYY
jgi:hypothetical protein